MTACAAPEYYGAGENCEAVTIPYQPLPTTPSLAETGGNPFPLIALAVVLIVAAVILNLAARRARATTGKSRS